MQKTKINWADSVWNPITGCSPISAGCERCYASRMATRLRGRYGYPDKNPFRVTLHPDKLLQPLSTRKPRRIFISSMSDWMHPDVPDDYRDKMLAIMALTPWHTYYTLTKRADNLLRYFQQAGTNIHVSAEAVNLRAGIDAKTRRRLPSALNTHPCGGNVWPLPNVYLGVTTENQEMLDLRAPPLLQLGAMGWRTMVSAEPLLSDLDLHINDRRENELWRHYNLPVAAENQRPSWVIVGGETGPGARPMHPDWARSVRDQCAAAGVPFFFKGWGDWSPTYAFVRGIEINPDGTTQRGSLCAKDGTEKTYGGAVTMFHVGKKAAGRVLDGKTHDARPNPKGN